MAVQQPVALNQSGDYCCPGDGCGQPIEVSENPGTASDISGRQVEAFSVASMGIAHTDTCSVIAQIRRG